MTLKVPCQHCGVNIEHDDWQSGTEAKCPACGQLTRLVPNPAPALPSATTSTKPSTANNRQFVPATKIIFTILGSMVVALTFSTVALLIQNGRLQRQLTRAQESLQSAQAAAEKERKIQQKALEDANLNAAVAEAKDVISGIYVMDDSSRGQHLQMDIRTDGTLVLSHLTTSFGQVYKKENLTWSSDGTWLSCGNQKYRLEAGDLIDDQNRRWLHVR